MVLTFYPKLIGLFLKGRYNEDNKMIIGINGNEANVVHRVGVGQYVFELLKQFKKGTISNVQWAIYLRESPLGDMPGESENWKYKVVPGKGLWTLTTLQKTLITQKMRGEAPDIFFTPSHYAPLYLPMPSVISIMDVSYQKFPQYFKRNDLLQLQHWTRISAGQAKKIITISEFSKREIVKLFRCPEEKVVVTPLGYDRERFNRNVTSHSSLVTSTLKKYEIKGEYFIYLGTLQPKKNVGRLVEAFARLENKETKLVIAGMINEGRGGWMYQEIFDKVEKLGVKDRVIFTGYVLDDDVPYLMAGAKAYVLPSLYEGFGIPPIEAMAVGTPVIVSKVASLPEVCGNAAIYIDNPEDVAQITDKLTEVLEMDPKEREKIIDLGLELVKRYNWEKTAEKTRGVLKEVGY